MLHNYYILNKNHTQGKDVTINKNIKLAEIILYYWLYMNKKQFMKLLDIQN